MSLDRKTIIDALNEKLAKNYVFPEVAEQIGAFLRQQLEGGHYDSINDMDGLGVALTRDVQSISKDLHMRVDYNPKQVEMLAQREAEQTGDEDDYTLPDEFKKEQRYDNYGFYKVERLTGNVGYLDLRSFSPASIAGETAVATMNFLGNSDALIFDLRQNGGGSPDMIQLISTYLFEGYKHLNNFYFRPEDRTIQTWILPHVPGKRLPHAEVYVLTSRYTFSGAEEFTYNLKNMKRATIIGETTGGGANPGNVYSVCGAFTVFIPTGRAINPISGTNWEGTGVEPDIEMPAAEALTFAHLDALRKLVAKAANDEERALRQWELEHVEAEYQPVKVDSSLLEGYCGVYGDRHISIENGALNYRRANYAYTLPLKPLADNVFMINHQQRAHFSDGNLVMYMRNGQRQTFTRKD